MDKKTNKRSSKKRAQTIKVFDSVEENKNQPESLRDGSGKLVTMKNKFYNLALLIGIGLIVVSLLLKNSTKDADQIELSKNNDAGDELTVDNNTGMLNNGKDPDNISTNSGGVDYLEGFLTVSDNLNSGSLKLVSSLGNIYIRTTRDFSKLIGLQVLVLINGELENFKLLDIQTALHKDGYILPQ